MQVEQLVTSKERNQMQRRKFFKLMAAGAGAAVLPLAGNLGCATKPKKIIAATPAASVSPGESPTSFGIADCQAVQGEGFGPNGGSVGPGTWDGVPLQAPSDVSD